MILAYQWYKRNKAKKAEEARIAQQTANQGVVESDMTETGLPSRESPIQNEKSSESQAVQPVQPVKPLKPQETQASKEETRRRRIYRWKLILALCPAGFLASVDLTVVSTAITTIASDFEKLNQFNWIVTAYSLTSTAFIPAYGQLSDTFGRHTALQISMFFMVLGSTLCAAAQNFTMLLFGRAFQGLSAAGIMNMIKIILADKVTLDEQSKNQTIFALVNGISYSVGPIIGGSLARINWRYCFVISIPIAVLSHVLIFVFLRKELVKGTHLLTGPDRKPILSGLSTIDYIGTLLFVFGTGLIILGTSWGGSIYSWSSAHVLAPLVIGSILFVLFWIWEYFLEPGRFASRLFPTQVAMIPWGLFKRKDTLSLTLVQTATGAAMYSAFYFVGIFWTLAQNYNPAKAGYQLLYYLPGIGVGVYSAMFLTNFWPRQTFWPIWIGSIIEATGFSVLAWATNARKNVFVSVFMAVAGAGTGVRFMPNTLHAAGIWPTKLSSVMSLMDFALPFGGTIGIAIMSAVFYNKFDAALVKNVGNAGIASSHNSTQSVQGINSLPSDIQGLVRGQAAHAIMWSFISILPLMALSVLGATVMGNVWIRPKKPTSEAEARGAVIYSSFLIALLTGQVKSRKVPIDVRQDSNVKSPPPGELEEAQVA